MDSYASGGVGATLVLVAGLIYKFVDHKRVRSRCCGYSASIDVVDVKDTTPKFETPVSSELKTKTPE